MLHVLFKIEKPQLANIMKNDASPQVVANIASVSILLRCFTLQYKCTQKVHASDHESLPYLLATIAYYVLKLRTPKLLLAHLKGTHFQTPFQWQHSQPLQLLRPHNNFIAQEKKKSFFDVFTPCVLYILYLLSFFYAKQTLRSLTRSPRLYRRCFSEHL